MKRVLRAAMCTEDGDVLTGVFFERGGGALCAETGAICEEKQWVLAHGFVCLALTGRTGRGRDEHPSLLFCVRVVITRAFFFFFTT